MKRLIILISVFSLFFSGVNAQNSYRPKTADYRVDNVSFSMVEMAGGNFVMGATDNFSSESDNNEKPAHRVALHSFAIGRTEVSQDLWVAVMGDNPSLFQNSKNLPVESVSYNDCLRFIAKLNSITGKKFRLPTEAEWEFAARGGNMCEDVYCGRGVPGQCATTGTISIASYGSDWHIYDMSGNVREWCSDWMGRYPSSAQTNPKGPSSGSERVCRGGGWGDPKWKCRSTSRDSHSPDYVSGDLGFRLAMDVDVEGKIVGYPEVESVKNNSGKPGQELSLRSVGIFEDKTVLRFSFTSPEKAIITMESPIYLSDPETGARYRIKDTDNMNVYSGRYSFSVDAGKPYSFTITFVPVSAKTRVLDWVAGDLGINGIRIALDSPKIKRTESSTSSPIPSSSAEAIPFSDLDQKPTFNGGSANQFSSWVNSRLKYPEESRKNGSSGRVVIGLTISKDGSVQNIRVVRSSGDTLLDEEALRVVRMSPKWSPGMKDGKRVDASLTFSVTFALN